MSQRFITSGFLLLALTPLMFALYTCFRERERLANWLAIRPRRLLLPVAAGCILAACGAGAASVASDLGLVEEGWLSAAVEVLPHWAVIGVVVVVGPLGEELYFRGRLLRMLDTASRPNASAAISSALFALVHAGNGAHAVAFIPYYFLIGAAFALIRRKTGEGGVLTASVAHAVHNLTLLTLAGHWNGF